MKKSYLIIGFILLYFFTRLFHLDTFPIFNDESTYIRYGMHEINEPTHAPYSLLIGKEPFIPYLFGWFGVSSGNFLVAARFVVVLFGFLTLVGIYLTTRKLTGEKSAVFASLLYIVVPYTLFFDRLALLDSPVNTVAVWSLYFTLRLLEKRSLTSGAMLGAVMGVGLWIKSSDFFYIVLPLIGIGIPLLLRKEKHPKKSLLIYVGALGLAGLIFLPLFLHPYYAVHRELMKQYTYPFFSVFSFPISLWWGNLVSAVSWLFFYLTPPVFLIALSGVYFLRKERQVWIVFLWFILPFIYEALYAKLFTSRHVLLLTIPLFILAGSLLSMLFKRFKNLVFGLILLSIIWSAIPALTLYTHPQSYPSLFYGRARDDLITYVHGFSSGYGVLEAIQYVKEQADKKQSIVVIRDDHGNPEDAVVAYLAYNPTTKVILLKNPPEQIASVLQIAASTIPIYYVSRGAYYDGLEKYMSGEKRFMKPHDTEFVGVSLLKSK